MQTGRRSGFSIVLMVVLLVVASGFPRLPVSAKAKDACDIPLVTTDERASEILAQERPFELTNQDIVFSYLHPDWDASESPQPLQGPAPDEETAKGELFAFLQRRFPCDSAAVQRGMRVYADAIARQKVPDPTLRAALAALMGTVGEPAIGFLLYEIPVVSVTFGVAVDFGIPMRIAMSYMYGDGTRSIVIDRQYRFAPFDAFSALIAHEAMHMGMDEDRAGLPEEAIASSVEALVYMEMLLVDPALATLPDELTRVYNNPTAIARLNSGVAGTDDLNLFVPDSDVNIDPTAPEPLTEFYEYYASNEQVIEPGFRERETEGNTMLREILVLLAEPGAEPPEDADFDAATLAFVDQNEAALSPAELVTVACILQLDAPCDDLAEEAAR